MSPKNALNSVIDYLQKSVHLNKIKLNDVNSILGLSPTGLQGLVWHRAYVAPPQKPGQRPPPDHQPLREAAGQCGLLLSP